MPDIQDRKGYPYYFFLLYALTYMANAVFNTFFPVYLDNIGFSKANVGILLALGPLTAIVAQPFWGIASDSASSKNSILKIIVAGSAASIILFPLSDDFIYLFAVIAVFTLFQSSVCPLSDAITLEHLESTRWKFGPIRLAGTLGFAAMSLIAGAIAKQDISNIFILFFCISVATFLAIFRLPKINGHRLKSSKITFMHLFRNYNLMILIAFNFIIQLTFGFYYSFFPIYYKQLGASSALLGLAMFITSTSELPFLLFADKILDRLGVGLTLVISALVISVRWLLLHYVTDINALLAINATHGFSFIVFAFCLATYINKNVPVELKSSGQTMNALFCMGLARVIGSILGGVLSDAVGIKQVFFLTSLISLGAAVLFGAFFLYRNKSVRKEYAPDRN